jgi:hypothetical protein
MAGCSAQDSFRLAFFRFQNWPMVLVASSSHSRLASSAISSTALKNFTAFTFGLPNGRSLPNRVRMDASKPFNRSDAH